MCGNPFRATRLLEIYPMRDFGNCSASNQKQAHGGMETTLRGSRGFCLQGQSETAPQGVRKHALGASKMRRAGVGNGPAAAVKSALALGQIGSAPGPEPVSRILKNRFQEEQKLSPILGADSEPKTGLIFRARY